MTSEPSCKDEARIGQKGELTRQWAPRGTRPRQPRDQRYQAAYLFGAVCPSSGATAALVLPAVNTEAMSLHLAEIGRHVAADGHAVVILDQAGWHGAHALRIPDNVSLLPLPPYSPELNPIENLWQFLKHNFLNTGSSPATRPSSTPVATPGTACASYRTRSAPSPPEHGQNRSITRTVGMRACCVPSASPCMLGCSTCCKAEATRLPK